MIMEQALLHFPERAEMLFTKDGRCVGWTLDGQVKVHHNYEGSQIV
jgi:hypothetical protein